MGQLKEGNKIRGMSASEEAEGKVDRKGRSRMSFFALNTFESACIRYAPALLQFSPRAEVPLEVPNFSVY